MLLEGNIRGLQHIGIPVINIEQSKNWYTKVLNFKVIYETVINPGEKGEIKVAFLNLGDLIIELYQLPIEELMEIKSRGDGHIDHIALNVVDVEKAYQTLKNAGIHIVEDKPVFLPFWMNGVKYFNILGPNREKIELIQVL